MTRDQAFREMEEMFGVVPDWWKSMPGHAVGPHWALVKAVQFEKGAIPHKYRELIGLTVAAAASNHAGVWNFTQTAKTFGASQEEIDEAIHYASVLPGLLSFAASTTTFGTFREQVQEALEHFRKKQR